MASGEQLAEVEDWFGFAELSGEKPNIISPVVTTKSVVKLSQDLKCSEVNKVHRKVDDKNDLNEVVVPIASNKLGITKYKVLARQKVEDDDDNEDVSCNEDKYLFSDKFLMKSIHMRRNSTWKGTFDKLNRNILSKSTPDRILFDNKKFGIIRKSNEKEKSIDPKTESHVVAHAKKSHTKGKISKQVENQETSRKKVNKKSLNDKKESVPSGKKKKEKFPKSKCSETESILPMEESSKVDTKSHSSEFVEQNQNTEVQHVAVVCKSSVNDIKDLHLKSDEEEGNVIIESKSDLVEKAPSLTKCINLEGKQTCVSPCRVELKRDASVESLHAAVVNESVAEESDSKIDQRTVCLMKMDEGSHKAESNNYDATSENNMLSRRHSLDHCPIENELLKRQSSLDESKLKAASMVYNAEIELRKSGRLRSAKCSSRYRGDYGIRADTYSKLKSSCGSLVEEYDDGADTCSSGMKLDLDQTSDCACSDCEKCHNVASLNKITDKRKKLDAELTSKIIKHAKNSKGHVFASSKKINLTRKLQRKTSKPQQRNFHSESSHAKHGKKLPSMSVDDVHENNETIILSNKKTDCIVDYLSFDGESTDDVKLNLTVKIDELNCDHRLHLEKLRHKSCQENSSQKCESCEIEHRNCGEVMEITSEFGDEKGIEDSKDKYSKEEGKNRTSACRDITDTFHKCKKLVIHSDKHQCDKLDKVPCDSEKKIFCDKTCIGHLDIDLNKHGTSEKIVGELCKDVPQENAVYTAEHFSLKNLQHPNYVHSVGKSVNKKENQINERKYVHAEEQKVKNVIDISPEASPPKGDPFTILEDLRLKLFEKAGANLEESDKPKQFECKLISSKRKESLGIANSAVSISGCLDSVEKEKMDSCSADVSICRSGRSTPRSGTPKTLNESSNEILEEVAQTLNSIHQAKRKAEELKSEKVSKPKRQKFEQKKFMLRSMLKKPEDQSTELSEAPSVEYSSKLECDSSTKLADPISDVNEDHQTSEFVVTDLSNNSIFTNDLQAEEKDETDEFNKLDIPEVKTVKTENHKLTKCLKQKPVKCQACSHTFKTKELLRKHYPCRIRQTRTWSQNILRPNRAFRRNEKKDEKFKCKLPKNAKADCKPRPQLLTQRKTKFRRVKGKRRRKLYQLIHELMDKRKVVQWPHLSVSYENLSFKEQCMYKIGLSCTGNPSKGLESYCEDEIEWFERHRVRQKEIDDELLELAAYDEIAEKESEENTMQGKNLSNLNQFEIEEDNNKTVQLLDMVSKNSEKAMVVQENNDESKVLEAVCYDELKVLESASSDGTVILETSYMKENVEINLVNNNNEINLVNDKVFETQPLPELEKLEEENNTDKDYCVVGPLTDIIVEMNSDTLKYNMCDGQSSVSSTEVSIDDIGNRDVLTHETIQDIKQIIDEVISKVACSIKGNQSQLNSQEAYNQENMLEMCIVSSERYGLQKCPDDMTTSEEAFQQTSETSCVLDISDMNVSRESLADSSGNEERKKGNILEDAENLPKCTQTMKECLKLNSELNKTELQETMLCSEFGDPDVIETYEQINTENNSSLISDTNENKVIEFSSFMHLNEEILIRSCSDDKENKVSTVENNTLKLVAKSLIDNDPEVVIDQESLIFNSKKESLCDDRNVFVCSIGNSQIEEEIPASNSNIELHLQENSVKDDFSTVLYTVESNAANSFTDRDLDEASGESDFHLATETTNKLDQIGNIKNINDKLQNCISTEINRLVEEEISESNEVQVSDGHTTSLHEFPEILEAADSICEKPESTGFDNNQIQTDESYEQKLYNADLNDETKYSAVGSPHSDTFLSPSIIDTSQSDECETVQQNTTKLSPNILSEHPNVPSAVKESKSTSTIRYELNGVLISENLLTGDKSIICGRQEVETVEVEKCEDIASTQEATDSNRFHLLRETMKPVSAEENSYKNKEIETVVDRYITSDKSCDMCVDSSKTDPNNEDLCHGSETNVEQFDQEENKLTAIIQYESNGVLISENLLTGDKSVVCPEHNASTHLSEESQGEDSLPESESKRSEIEACNITSISSKDKDIQVLKENTEIYNITDTIKDADTSEAVDDVLKNNLQNENCKWNGSGLGEQTESETDNESACSGVSRMKATSTDENSFYFQDKNITSQSMGREKNTIENVEQSENFLEIEAMRGSVDERIIEDLKKSNLNDVSVYDISESDDQCSSLDGETISNSEFECNNTSGIEEDFPQTIDTETPPVLEKVDVPNNTVEIYEETVCSEDSQMSEDDPPLLIPEQESIIKNSESVEGYKEDENGIELKKTRVERHFLDVLGDVCSVRESLPNERDVLVYPIGEHMKKANTYNASNQKEEEFIGRHFSDVMETSVEPERKSRCQLQPLLEESGKSQVTLAKIKEMLKPQYKQESIFTKELLLKLRADIANLLTKVKIPVKKDPVWLKRDSLAAYCRRKKKAYKPKMKNNNISRKYSADDKRVFQLLDQSHSDNDENDEFADDETECSDLEEDIQTSDDETHLVETEQQKPVSVSQGKENTIITKGGITENILQMLTSFEDKGNVAVNVSNLLDILAENLGFSGKARESITNNESILESDSDSDYSCTDRNDTGMDYNKQKEVSQSSFHDKFDLSFGEDEPPSLDDIPFPTESLSMQDSSSPNEMADMKFMSHLTADLLQTERKQEQFISANIQTFFKSQSSAALSQTEDIQDKVITTMDESQQGLQALKSHVEIIKGTEKSENNVGKLCTDNTNEENSIKLDEITANPSMFISSDDNKSSVEQTHTEIELYEKHQTSTVSDAEIDDRFVEEDSEKCMKMSSDSLRNEEVSIEKICEKQKNKSYSQKTPQESINLNESDLYISDNASSCYSPIDSCSQSSDLDNTSFRDKSGKGSDVNTLFKSITELNSIETDDDSNLGDSYDAVSMSHRMFELKAISKDVSNSEVNSEISDISDCEYLSGKEEDTDQTIIKNKNSGDVDMDLNDREALDDLSGKEDCIEMNSTDTVKQQMSKMADNVDETESDLENEETQDDFSCKEECTEINSANTLKQQISTMAGNLDETVDKIESDLNIEEKLENVCSKKIDVNTTDIVTQLISKLEEKFNEAESDQNNEENLEILCGKKEFIAVNSPEDEKLKDVCITKEFIGTNSPDILDLHISKKEDEFDEMDSKLNDEEKLENSSSKEEYNEMNSPDIVKVQISENADNLDEMDWDVIGVKKNDNLEGKKEFTEMNSIDKVEQQISKVEHNLDDTELEQNDKVKLDNEDNDEKQKETKISKLLISDKNISLVTEQDSLVGDTTDITNDNIGSNHNNNDCQRLEEEPVERVYDIVETVEQENILDLSIETKSEDNEYKYSSIIKDKDQSTLQANMPISSVKDIDSSDKEQVFSEPAIDSEVKEISNKNDTIEVRHGIRNDLINNLNYEIGRNSVESVSMADILEDTASNASNDMFSDDENDKSLQLAQENCRIQLNSLGTLMADEEVTSTPDTLKHSAGISFGSVPSGRGKEAVSCESFNVCNSENAASWSYYKTMTEDHNGLNKESCLCEMKHNECCLISNGTMCTCEDNENGNLSCENREHKQSMPSSPQSKIQDHDQDSGNRNFVTDGTNELESASSMVVQLSEDSNSTIDYNKEDRLQETDLLKEELVPSKVESHKEAIDLLSEPSKVNSFEEAKVPNEKISSRIEQEVMGFPEVFCETIAEKVKRKQRERLDKQTKSFSQQYVPYRLPVSSVKEISIFRSSMLDERMRQSSLPCDNIKLIPRKKRQRYNSVPKEVKLARCLRNRSFQIKPCSVKLRRLDHSTIQKYLHPKSKEDDTRNRPPIKLKIRLRDIVIPCSPYSPYPGSSSTGTDDDNSEANDGSQNKSCSSLSCDNDLVTTEEFQDEPLQLLASVYRSKSVDNVTHRLKPLKIKLKDVMSKSKSCDFKLVSLPKAEDSKLVKKQKSEENGTIAKQICSRNLHLSESDSDSEGDTFEELKSLSKEKKTVISKQKSAENSSYHVKIERNETFNKSESQAISTFQEHAVKNLRHENSSAKVPISNESDRNSWLLTDGCTSENVQDSMQAMTLNKKDQSVKHFSNSIMSLTDRKGIENQIDLLENCDLEANLMKSTDNTTDAERQQLETEEATLCLENERFVERTTSNVFPEEFNYADETANDFEICEAVHNLESVELSEVTATSETVVVDFKNMQERRKLHSFIQADSCLSSVEICESIGSVTSGESCISTEKTISEGISDVGHGVSNKYLYGISEESQSSSELIEEQVVEESIENLVLEEEESVFISSCEDSGSLNAAQVNVNIRLSQLPHATDEAILDSISKGQCE